MTAKARKMAILEEAPPLTEPVIVSCLYADGAAVTLVDGVVRIVAWNELPHFGGETEERRIVVRLAIPDSAARALVVELQRILVARGQH